MTYCVTYCVTRLSRPGAEYCTSPRDSSIPFLSRVLVVVVVCLSSAPEVLNITMLFIVPRSRS